MSPAKKAAPARRPTPSQETEMRNYRTEIREWAQRAVENGASINVINNALADLGVEGVSSTGVHIARVPVQVYMHVEMRGTRKEAEDEVARHIAHNTEAGRLDWQDDASGFQAFPADTEWCFDAGDHEGPWLPAEEYWAAHTPPAPNPTSINTLTELKQQTRRHLLTLARVYRWNCGIFRNAWQSLGLGDVPTSQGLVETRVQISGTAEVSLTRFVGDADEDVAEAARILAGDGGIDRLLPGVTVVAG